MKELEKRLVKLEGSLELSSSPRTLREAWEAFDRGEYGDSSMMALVVSVLSNGGSVEHLRGEYPDLLLDDLAECVKKHNEDASGLAPRKRGEDGNGEN